MPAAAARPAALSGALDLQGQPLACAAHAPTTQTEPVASRHSIWGPSAAGTALEYRRTVRAVPAACHTMAAARTATGSQGCMCLGLRMLQPAVRKGMESNAHLARQGGLVGLVQALQAQLHRARRLVHLLYVVLCALDKVFLRKHASPAASPHVLPSAHAAAGFEWTGHACSPPVLSCPCWGVTEASAALQGNGLSR